MTSDDLADPAIEPHNTILAASLMAALSRACDDARRREAAISPDYRSCQRAQWEGALKQLHRGERLTIQP